VSLECENIKLQKAKSPIGCILKEQYIMKLYNHGAILLKFVMQTVGNHDYVVSTTQLSISKNYFHLLHCCAARTSC